MDTPDEPPFYLVWNPAGRAPTHKHDNEPTARAEATRLARENPGQVFYVLMPVCEVVRQDVVVRRFSAEITF